MQILYQSVMVKRNLSVKPNPLIYSSCLYWQCDDSNKRKQTKDESSTVHVSWRISVTASTTWLMQVHLAGQLGFKTFFEHDFANFTIVCVEMLGTLLCFTWKTWSRACLRRRPQGRSRTHCKDYVSFLAWESLTRRGDWGEGGLGIFA